MIITDKPTIIKIPVFTDERGALGAPWSPNIIPFEIKRCFYIFGSHSGAKRADHATYSCEFIICINGNCVVATDNGSIKDRFELDAPDKGLYLPGLVWRELFIKSDDCVLLCFSDKPYLKSDYLNDKNDFYDIVNKR